MCLLRERGRGEAAHRAAGVPFQLDAVQEDHRDDHPGQQLPHRDKSYVYDRIVIQEMIKNIA